MKQYIVLADSITGYGNNIFSKGEIVNEDRLANLPFLLEGRFVAEVEHAVEREIEVSVGLADTPIKSKNKS